MRIYGETFAYFPGRVVLVAGWLKLQPIGSTGMTSSRGNGNGTPASQSSFAVTFTIRVHYVKFSQFNRSPAFTARLFADNWRCLDQRDPL